MCSRLISRTIQTLYAIAYVCVLIYHLRCYRYYQALRRIPRLLFRGGGRCARRFSFSSPRAFIVFFGPLAFTAISGP